MSKSTESISKGIDVSLKNPAVFLPSLAPIVIELLFGILAYVIFPIRVLEFYYPNTWIVWSGYFVALLVGFIASCVTIDMAHDAVNQQPVNLNKSVNVVTSRLGDLIVAAVIAALCGITIILLPVAFFIVAIAIVDKTDAVESTKRAFDFVIKNLGEVIIFLILVIVISIIFTFVFGFIPIVGPYLGAIIRWILYAVFSVASVHFYISLKQASPMPPPPPPPPP